MGDICGAAVAAYGDAPCIGGTERQADGAAGFHGLEIDHRHLRRVIRRGRGCRGNQVADNRDRFIRRHRHRSGLAANRESGFGVTGANINHPEFVPPPIRDEQ